MLLKRSEQKETQNPKEVVSVKEERQNCYNSHDKCKDKEKKNITRLYRH